MTSKRTGVRPFHAAALFLGLMSGAAYAQELVCKGLPPLQGSQFGYQKRGERCEGLYVANVGSQSLAATSFSLGKVRFDLKSSVQLQISAPGQTGPVHVRAVAIPPKTYYRMDAPLPAGSSLLWPVRDVLLPEKLSDSRIGIFAWKGSEEGKTLVLVPVRVVPEGGAATPAPPFLVVQASFDAQQVRWRSAPAREGGCLVFGPWQDAIQRSVTASWPIAINLGQLPAGLSCFEAAAQSGSSSTWETLKLRLEIPSR